MKYNKIKKELDLMEKKDLKSHTRIKLMDVTIKPLILNIF